MFANNSLTFLEILVSLTLTDHAGKAAESGGPRTEGLVWVQFFCKRAKDTLEGGIELQGQERYPA